MKNLLVFLLTFICLIPLKAEPLSYYEQFFDRVNDVTHDPDFPQLESVHAKNDLYQVVMTGDDSALGLILSFSLKPSGQYSFWMLPVKHRWKNGQRQIRIGKCEAFNGDWQFKDGRLVLGNDLILEATFADGQNLLRPTFVNAKRPAGTEAIELTINDGSIDTIGGVGPDSPTNGQFRCGGFQIPFWIPIPNVRPW
jgi:hypothetical protein